MYLCLHVNLYTYTYTSTRAKHRHAYLYVGVNANQTATQSCTIASSQGRPCELTEVYDWMSILFALTYVSTYKYKYTH